MPLSDRAHRQTPQPKNKLKIILFVFLGCLFLVGLGFLLTRKPTDITCETEIYTLCSDNIAQEFTNLKETPLFKLRSVFMSDLANAQKQKPELVNATLRFQPLFHFLVQIKTAEVLFPYEENGQTFAVLSNGSTIPSDDQSLPTVTFSTPETRQQLTGEEQKNLTQLRKKLQSFTPRIKTLAVNSSTEVVAAPENFGNVVFTLYDVDRQTATLQAFFRSTTMDHEYHTLDVRFANQAVIKD